MKFGTYILISASVLWFIFGSVFFYRASWKLKNAFHSRNILTETAIRYNANAKKSTVLVFRLKNLNDTFGIHRRKLKKYDQLLRDLKIGDTIDLYYEKWNLSEGEVNTQIVQLKSNQKMLVSYEERRNRDLITAMILYTISLILFLFTIYSRKQELARPVFKHSGH